MRPFKAATDAVSAVSELSPDARATLASLTIAANASYDTVRAVKELTVDCRDHADVVRKELIAASSAFQAMCIVIGVCVLTLTIQELMR